MSREQLTNFLYRDDRGPYQFYIKKGTEGHFIRRPAREISGYHLLAPYLRMPKARLANTSEGHLLVVRGVEAQAVNTILKDKPHLAKDSLQRFLNDMYAMWHTTTKSMDETVVSRNWRLETLNTLYRLRHNEKIMNFAHVPTIVNGVTYPCLHETLTQCQIALENKIEKHMVLCHGDEHPGNVLCEEDNYYAIDPGNYTGYNMASSALNNLAGALYLFEYRYQGTFSCGDTFNVEYQLDPNFAPAESCLRPLILELDEKVKNVSGSTSLAKELFFINAIRVSIGWTQRSMQLDDVLETGLVLAGVATEQYYSSTIV